MNAITAKLESTAQADLLKQANFEPVFDEDGQIVDIREMKISTDRRAGVKAMRELLDTHVEGDHVIGADGWTMKQKRILSTPAPLAAHYLRYSQKWDSRTGMMRDAAMIQLPLEVVWTLFEGLFEGQYSVNVVELHSEDESIAAIGNVNNNDAEDAPGHRFYARATVCIKIHLPGQSQPREFYGVGVSYGQVRVSKTGNTYALNSEQRTVDKGAVADAKKEALTNIGRVFRRAFEDGDDMVDHVENLLLAKIREANKPAIFRRGPSPEAVPAPVKRPTLVSTPPALKPDAVENGKAETPQVAQAKPETKASAKKTRKPAVKAQDTVTVSIPNAPDRLVKSATFADDILDIIYETCADVAQINALLEANAEAIKTHVKDKTGIAEAIATLSEQEEAGSEDDYIPEFDTPADKAEEPAAAREDAETIAIEGKSGKSVLAEFVALINAAKSIAGIDAIIAANPEALRKLTPKQMVQMTTVRSEKQASLKV